MDSGAPFPSSIFCVINSTYEVNGYGIRLRRRITIKNIEEVNGQNAGFFFLIRSVIQKKQASKKLINMSWLMNSLSFSPLSDSTFKMINKSKVFTTFVRNYAIPKEWKKDAVKYEQVTYYPRHPNHKDPPFTPSKLLMVKLVKRFAGNPYWHKAALKNLGIAEKGRKPVVVKNTPEICALLWSVKHLVKITPIKLPEKLPNEDELGASYLHENGTFYVIPKIDPLRIQCTEEFENNPKKLDDLRVGEKLRLQWLNSGLY